MFFKLSIHLSCFSIESEKLHENADNLQREGDSSSEAGREAEKADSVIEEMEEAESPEKKQLTKGEGCQGDSTKKLTRQVIHFVDENAQVEQ